MRVAQVLMPLPLEEAFDYAVPEGMEVAAGDHVCAPLGSRQAHGVVLSVSPREGVNRPLKPLQARLDEPSLPPGTLEFVGWAAKYSADAPGCALSIALKGLRAPRPRPERKVAVTGAEPGKLTDARLRVLEVAREKGPLGAAPLARAAGVGAAVVKSLVEEGALHWVAVEKPASFPAPDLSRPGAVLNASQATAAEALRALVGGQDGRGGPTSSALSLGISGAGEDRRRAESSGFAVALLDGVTGSGKTEVYLEAVAAALEADPGAQVLVLLPEIALTQAVLARFKERFGVQPAEWHSAVSGTKRRRVWEAVATGRARIVVGARSALFLPFLKLRLIVVDEEHDSSYKQEEGFIYHARDFAVARGKIEGAAVVLASATPSLETLRNAEAGRYRWLKLGARHGAAVMPEVSLIDLRETPPERGRWLSPPLVESMVETLGWGEQVLLFLNRRGYAPVVLCTACGEKLTAPDTDSWLVEHRYTGRLVCHLTGFSMPKPERCPHCGATGGLTSIGPGVERVEEEVRERFPEARTAIFSSDTVFGAEQARAMVERMAAGGIDVMVATQAAAKGHNFPKLTLVGVVDADLGLRGGDLRAGERTFQLLAQASGRAGRAERPGRALLQTWMPEHSVMQALVTGDREAFLNAEMFERQAAGLPPFGRLAALIASGPDPEALERYVGALAAATPEAEGVEVYGPADAPLGLVRGRRRKRFLVRADRTVDLQGFVNAWRARVKAPGSVRLTVDIDPYSFL
ncbi:MAG: primosomal protein N' [Proteobacteria bacterium]|nr:primosomal protein N' [Pseudomonadota bacterium]